MIILLIFNHLLFTLHVLLSSYVCLFIISLNMLWSLSPSLAVEVIAIYYLYYKCLVIAVFVTVTWNSGKDSNTIFLDILDSYWILLFPLPHFGTVEDIPIVKVINIIFIDFVIVLDIVVSVTGPVEEISMHIVNFLKLYLPKYF